MASPVSFSRWLSAPTAVVQVTLLFLGCWDGAIGPRVCGNAGKTVKSVFRQQPNVLPERRGQKA